MWLNDEKVVDSAISVYRESLLNSCPNHIVIDGLFNEAKLDDVINILQQPNNWKAQKHTYSALYVDSTQWLASSKEQRFVQRDSWQPRAPAPSESNHNIAQEFLFFLRSPAFLYLLSHIFNVRLTDINLVDPEINTNYFRLSTTDFVAQHADDSPGREVCMLLYLNKDWQKNAGGELVFNAKNSRPISIAPLYNRCVLFDPSSKGAEHWVKKTNPEYSTQYRYNVTSWYWSE
jgi:Rps23 Pro-64 3,4-dihydroxylase Tpa1-like proline 4-hydroxylase